MNQQGIAPILIVLLIALAVGGYLFIQKQSKPAIVPQPSPSPIASDETADWKTYKNDIFSVKYPSKLKVEESKGSVDENPKWRDVITVIFTPVIDRRPSGLYDSVAMIRIFDKPKFTEAEVEGNYFSGLDESGWKPITIGINEGKITTGLSTDVNSKTSKLAPDGKVAVFSTKDKYFYFHLKQSYNHQYDNDITENDFYQLLSTFKLLP